MDMVNQRTIRTVLYDFDGTLADTTELVMECYRLTMEEQQWRCCAVDVVHGIGLLHPFRAGLDGAVQQARFR